LEAVAKNLQLNVGLVKSAISTKKHGARIQRDVAMTRPAGVTGTPTFFLNGEMVMGAQPFDKFEAVILRLKGSPAPEAPPPAPRLVIPVPGDAPSRGPMSAKVTIQVFADLQCPFSARALGGANGPSGDFARFLAAHKNEVRLVYRHHPLPFHTMAETAHNLALEAKAQKGDDGFWRVVFAIYKAMNEGRASPYDQAFLEGIAKAEGLDVERCKTAMATKKYSARIMQDDALAKDMGTPTFIIGDEKVVGAQSADVFEAAFERVKSK
jgi:protein-disulfide isomerase